MTYTEYDALSVLMVLEKVCNEYIRADPDQLTLEEMLEGRRQLVCNLFYWATFVGKLYKDKNACEFARKAKFSRVLNAKRMQEKMNVSEATRAAEHETTTELQKEFEADAEYKRAILLHDSFNKVADAMSQQIAHLRAEKERAYKNQE